MDSTTRLGRRLLIVMGIIVAEAITAVPILSLLGPSYSNLLGLFVVLIVLVSALMLTWKYVMPASNSKYKFLSKKEIGIANKKEIQDRISAIDRSRRLENKIMVAYLVPSVIGIIVGWTTHIFVLSGLFVLYLLVTIPVDFGFRYYRRRYRKKLQDVLSSSS